MTDQITPEIFDHLVDLAALQLNPDQAEYLRKQLNNQLKAIHELEAIPLEGDIPISLHGVPYSENNSALPREDVWVKYPDAQQIMGQAPQVEDNTFVVPDIPHQALK
jgi:aspartyl-tRNA(Asn)/glutamyl-tRNA(Gln) amidotransferase subunit C